MNKRRKLLLALSGASAATVWAKPVVNAVVLPAHAQTSCQLCIFLQATITGSWEGNRGMIIFDNCGEPPIFNQAVDWSAGVFDEQFCANLAPGTYTIEFGGGAGGIGSGSINISGQLEWCGNEIWSESDSDSEPDGGAGIGECGPLTVAPDGTCSFDDDGPCCLRG